MFAMLSIKIQAKRYRKHRSNTFKGKVQTQMKILSSFTQSHVVPNLYDCISYAEHKRRYFEECW